MAKSKDESKSLRNADPAQVPTLPPQDPKPSPPDWARWLCTEVVNLKDAVALWCALDPDAFGAVYSGREPETQHRLLQLRERRKIAFNHAFHLLPAQPETDDDEGSDPVVRLVDFVKWSFEISHVAGLEFQPPPEFAKIESPPWPWGDYQTRHLRSLKKAVLKYFAVGGNRAGQQSIKSKVITFLTQRGVKPSLAAAMDTIIRLQPHDGGGAAEATTNDQSHRLVTLKRSSTIVLSKPNWKVCLYLDSIPLYDAVALSCDLDPEEFGERYKIADGEDRQDILQLRARREVALNNAGGRLPTLPALDPVSHPVVHLFDFVRWLSKMQRLSNFWHEVPVELSRVPDFTAARPWPWGPYETRYLKALSVSVVKHFAPHKDPLRQQPRKKEVVDDLEQRGVNPSLARSIDTIIRTHEDEGNRDEFDDLGDGDDHDEVTAD